MYRLLGDVSFITRAINQLCKYIGRQFVSLFLFMIMSNKNYAMGHAFSLHDIFMNFPVEKLKMTSDQCKETYSDGNKRDLAASIFAKSVQMVVDDIIDNNVHFKLPGMARTQAYMYMKRTEGKNLRRHLRMENGMTQTL